MRMGGVQSGTERSRGLRSLAAQAQVRDSRGPQPRGLRGLLNRRGVAGWVCAAPFVIGFLAFTLAPMAMSLWYSFTDYDVIGRPRFIGLANYVEMLTHDGLFWQSLGVTMMFALVSVPLKLAFALAVALLLPRGTRLSGLWRAAFYLPSILGGSVAVAMLWRWMFATDGILNRTLRLFGIPASFAWLGDPRTAIWTLVALSVWQFGSAMLIFLAALGRIPRDVMEAANVDGAGRWSRFRHITLPLITPAIFFNLVMQLINGFLAFTQCYVITQGRPLNSTLFVMVHMYDETFSNYRAGYGAAMAWTMLVIVGALTLALFATRRFWMFDGELGVPGAGGSDAARPRRWDSVRGREYPIMVGDGAGWVLGRGRGSDATRPRSHEPVHRRGTTRMSQLTRRRGAVRWGAIAHHALAAVLSLVMVYPIAWMLLSSFKPTASVLPTAGQLWPRVWTLDNYVNGLKGFGGVGFPRFVANSLLIATASTVGVVLSSALVAYAFSRLRFRGRGLMVAAMMVTLLLPAQVLIVPQYLWFQRLGWTDSYLPLIVPYWFATQGFFVYLMMQFIDGIPAELDEAARLDGCSPYGVFLHVTLPLMRPALVSSFILSFIWRWDDFLGPLLYVSDTEDYPVSLALKLFSDPGSTTDYGAMFAMACVSILPSVLVFLFFQRRLVEGVSVAV